MSPPSITVLTATHNRADKLRRLYDSLLEQTYTDFEWLVVDDGSTDDTPELMAAFSEEARLRIRYLRKENGGKHTAVNLGVREAAAPMCAVMDDDDWYVPQALERLKHHWDAIPDPEAFVEVQGLCTTESGTLVGMPYPEPVFDSDYFELTEVLHLWGDRLGMIRTDVLRRYPFPESFAAGVWVDERIVWNRISASYRMRGINEVIGYKEYLDAGLTRTHRGREVAMSEQRLLYYEELLAMRRKLPLRSRFKAYANLIRNGLHQHRSPLAQLGSVPGKAWWLAAAPAGLVLFARDRRNASRSH